MRLSVIIPTRNEAANIADAIASAFAANADEVIVADGGSDDETTEIAAAAGAAIVCGAGCRGPQQNAGAATATGEVLLFLHADCRLGRHAKQAVKQQLDRSPKLVAGGFTQRYERTSAGWRRIYERYAFGLLKELNAFRAWRGTLYGDQAIWVTREAFDRAGGFPDWPLFEDVELSRRLGLGWGTSVIIEPPVVVDERRWRANGMLRQAFRNWRLRRAFDRGVPVDELARRYRARQKS